MSGAPAAIQLNYDEVIPGVYALVSNKEYHASDGLSKTNLCDIHGSIAEYNMRKASPQKQTDPMLKGSAFHDLVLLPDVYKQTYLVGPTIGKATKANKQFILDHPHKTVITVGMSDDIHYMRDALHANPTIRRILESDTVLREVSMWVKHGHVDLLCKIRPDIIEGGVIYDLKSTIAPDVRPFLHSVYKYKYHVQSAYYQDTANLNGLKITNFKFLVVGSKPPYLTAVYDLNADLIEEGADIYYAALLKYRKYLDGDKWDGLDYGRETVTL